MNRLTHFLDTLPLIMKKRLWSHCVKQWQLFSFKVKEKRELYLHFWWITAILPTLQQVFPLSKLFLPEMDTGLTYQIRDQNKKVDRRDVYNWSCLTKDYSYQVSGCVLVRNYRRRSKFNPYFLPEKFCIIDILADGNTL